MVSFLLKAPKTVGINGLEELFVSYPEPAFILKDDTTELMVWGDPIPGESFNKSFPQNRKVDFILDNLYGHYYFILLNPRSGRLIVGNSYFSILPIYYYETEESAFFSDNAIRLGRYCGKTNLSRRFIFETTLFNYPLFNHSVVEGINLLRSSSFFLLSGGKLEVIRHTNIDRSFVEEPSGWHNAIPGIADYFLTSSKKYFPEEHYFNSFTGGFDGRTLAASAISMGRRFTSFCFGSESSCDIQVAEAATRSAGIPFMDIILDDDYIKQESLNNGKEFILNSSGTGTFERAHYLFAAKQLKERGKWMVTGNFGSEILKSPHSRGELLSQNIFQLFKSPDPESAFEIIERSTEFRVLNKESFKADWNELKSDLQKLPCYSSEYKHLSKNRQFYVFLFEEVFRKYFGAEMINQFNYIRNRTPFIDIDFIRVLLKTGLAGAYTQFDAENPVKRYKGQVLYAAIMRKAFPLLGRIKTDKGYRPDDLLTFSGKIRIAQNYFRKVLSRNINDPDPNQVLKSWNENRTYWLGLPSSPDLFSNNDELKKWQDVPGRLLFRICTINYLKAQLAGDED
jgi:asparagine synthetase B (glutamine-hydrolysing)